MGQKGREIVKMNVDELINLLNKSLSDEWLAYYQYWIGSKVVKGPMKEPLIKHPPAMETGPLITLASILVPVWISTLPTTSLRESISP